MQQLARSNATALLKTTLFVGTDREENRLLQTDYNM